MLPDQEKQPILIQRSHGSSIKEWSRIKQHCPGCSKTENPQIGDCRAPETPLRGMCNRVSNGLTLLFVYQVLGDAMSRLCLCQLFRQFELKWLTTVTNSDCNCFAKKPIPTWTLQCSPSKTSRKPRQHPKTTPITWTSIQQHVSCEEMSAQKQSWVAVARNIIILRKPRPIHSTWTNYIFGWRAQVWSKVATSFVSTFCCSVSLVVLPQLVHTIAKHV